MKRSIPILLALAVCLTIAPESRAEQAPDTYAGDLWSRSRLTGDWGGVRDTLTKRGVTLDVDVLGTPQGVVSGGRDTGWDIWGASEYTLHVDTQKLGLWPGGFLKFQADTSFGSNILKDTGAFVPVNTAALLPGVNDRTTALMNATLTQFLSPQFAVFAGKSFAAASPMPPRMRIRRRISRTSAT